MLNNVKFATELTEAKNYIIDLIKQKKIIPFVDKIFPLNDIIAAYDYMLSNQSTGKIIIKP
ncbi:MAG: zinc-binding dehydrogenase [Rhizobiales bacterium]|nr:zinc-binding dehydrogenase [Hyphomicrobiales bacterium]